MAADPKREAILQAMKARFGAIGGAGYTYAFTPDQVLPWLMTEPPVDSLPIITLRDEDEKIEEESMGFGPESTLRATMTVKVLAAIQATGDSKVEADVAREARLLLGDLLKAVGVDDTWGVDNACTQLKSTRIQVGGGDRWSAWAQIDLEIAYPFQRWDYTA